MDHFSNFLKPNRMTASAEDIDWLYDLYLFMRENETDNNNDICTIGWEGDKIAVRVGALKRGLKVLFSLIKCHEHTRKMLPAKPVFEENK
jgi:hypothetical protein